GLHISIADWVLTSTIDAGGLVNKPHLMPSFEPLARVYGYAGMLVRRVQQRPQLLADDIVHAWSQRKDKPPAPLREAVLQQVMHKGPEALDELSLNQPTRETMRRLLDKGMPLFLEGLHQEVVSVYTSDPRRTAPSKEIQEAEDLLTEIGVFWLLGFRWRWCTYRQGQHWYIADYREQYGCVRHRDAVQQDRYRSSKKKRQRGGR